jgi:hypothetical protein
VDAHFSVSLAHPCAPDAENVIRRTHDNARKTQHPLAVAGNRDTRAITLE